MKIKFYQVDAFTQHLFHGNSAGVCLLDEWLADDILLSIAAENNLSAMAFLVPRDDHYHIRWFTPEVEINLCGHGTLAASYVVMNIIDDKRKYVIFHSASGLLHVAKHGEMLQMDFPNFNFTACETPATLVKALGVEPLAVYLSKSYLVILNSEKTVRELNPNFELIKQLDLNSVIVTAKGNHVDFVSRYFAPKRGINEDPVTGSAHCILAPYWSEQLGIHKLKAQQLSKRGGEILCEVKGDRVLLSGHAKLYLSGKIEIA